MNNAASLAKMKKDELVDLCKKNGISGYSKLKKDELVDLLVKHLGSDEAAQAPAAEKAPEKEKAPARKKASCKKAAAPESELARYCTALVNLWGIAPVPMIIAVYQQYKGTTVSPEEVEAAASCPVIKGNLVHADLADNEEAINELLKKQSHYKHYLPTASQIDLFVNENYREMTHEFSAMCEFMVRTFDMKPEAAHDGSLLILKYLDDQSDIRVLMNKLAESGMHFTADIQFRNFAILLNNMKSASRFWGFSGHTPAEAANFEPSKGPIRNFKVGRNDPCPCGSGKKFKKCCGR